jgi:hypothetical protein
MTVKNFMVLSWIMARCSTVSGYQRSGAMCCLHLQGGSDSYLEICLPYIRLHGVTTRKLTTHCY